MIEHFPLMLLLNVTGSSIILIPTTSNAYYCMFELSPPCRSVQWTLQFQISISAHFPILTSLPSLISCAARSFRGTGGGERREKTKQTPTNRVPTEIWAPDACGGAYLANIAFTQRDDLSLTSECSDYPALRFSPSLSLSLPLVPRRDPQQRLHPIILLALVLNILALISPGLRGLWHAWRIL